MNTEVAEPGGGPVEMTPTYTGMEQDELPSVTISLLDPLDDPSQMEGEARSLADPRITEHLEEIAPITPKVSLSCEQCTYRTMEDGKKKNVQS